MFAFYSSFISVLSVTLPFPNFLISTTAFNKSAALSFVIKLSVALTAALAFYITSLSTAPTVAVYFKAVTALSGLEPAESKRVFNSAFLVSKSAVLKPQNGP